MILNNQLKFNQVKNLNLPLGHYAITGSGPLGIRNLREIADVDIIIDDILWDTLSKKLGVQEANGVIKIVFPDLNIEAFGATSFANKIDEENLYSIDQRISEAEVIDGLPFECLKHNIYYKRKMGREKDLKDISLIESWKKID